MKTNTSEFDHKEIEAKWRQIWQKNGVYEPDLGGSKSPFYNLMMFPYPSAEGLHVGNMYAFCGSDVYGRFKRMQGFDVLEPIGLDGFGIHSENYAMKIGEHPAELSKKTEENFYRQLLMIGNGFSWEHKLETYDPDYYRWTQWIFVQLFKAGLAYRSDGEVNWCPSCLTVLADEQVINSKKDTSDQKPGSNDLVSGNLLLETKNVCERCSTVVVKKKLTQWYFKITQYAQELLDGLEKIDWSEKVKIAQRNWIGKSRGAEIVFSIDIEKEYSVRIFTTRVDTIFGVTFLALAADHELLTTILKHAKGHEEQAIRQFLDHSSKNSNSKPQIPNKEGKNGVFTGFYATNPLSGDKVPVYVADYVLTGYGTGAVMGVPAHDARDFEFAKKYGIEIRQVVKGEDDDISQTAFTEYGKLINSDNYDGMGSLQAIDKLTADLEKKGEGKKTTNWHLRDWIISRQRYWGPPIPMIFCQKCAADKKSWFTQNKGTNGTKGSEGSDVDWDHFGWYPVEESELPVELPNIRDFKPKGKGEAPLAQSQEFVNVKCPGCGLSAKRETDVSDTFLDSAWYFLRYPSTGSRQVPWESAITKKWLPVDMYIGGAEHSVLHLLYSRFITKVFYDLKLVSFDEPFVKFRAHGLLIKDGAKMSKSRGNVVNPDDYIAKFGADTLRAYLMFCGRYSEGGDFRDEGIEGMQRFLKRVWRICQMPVTSNQEPGKESSFMRHKTIKKVTEDIENLSYNTAIAALMEWMNYLEKGTKGTEVSKVSKDDLESLVLMLAPFAPHLSDELWQVARDQGPGTRDQEFKSVHLEKWPVFDPDMAKSETITLLVQVNGKLRERIEVERGIGKEKSEQLALKSENVSKHINSSANYKVVYVPDRLINFVVGSGNN